ncbi:hypothetical protein GGR50DRAFT_701859 [Xylaria sp. CBS 124048]|nr:hypothetical protein GGR50DRAFT_701859 [Xylaria sp. CBS 124048]
MNSENSDAKMAEEREQERESRQRVREATPQPGPSVPSITTSGPTQGQRKRSLSGGSSERPNNKQRQNGIPSVRTMQQVYNEHRDMELPDEISQQLLGVSVDMIRQLLDDVMIQWCEIWYADTNLRTVVEAIIAGRKVKVGAHQYPVPPEALEDCYTVARVLEMLERCHEPYVDDSKDKISYERLWTLFSWCSAIIDILRDGESKEVIFRVWTKYKCIITSLQVKKMVLMDEAQKRLDLWFYERGITTAPKEPDHDQKAEELRILREVRDAHKAKWKSAHDEVTACLKVLLDQSELLHKTNNFVE